MVAAVPPLRKTLEESFEPSSPVVRRILSQRLAPRTCDRESARETATLQHKQELIVISDSDEDPCESLRHAGESKEVIDLTDDNSPNEDSAGINPMNANAPVKRTAAKRKPSEVNW